MEIKPFLVEEWMNQYEVGARYNIAETCVDSVSLDELFQLTGEDKEAFLSSLCARRLTYGDIFGQPAFLEGICQLYRDLRPEQVIPTHGAAGANHHLFCSLVEPGDKVISVLPTYQQLYSIPDSLGAQVELLPLSPDNGFLPDLARLEELARGGVKLICLNNPNNPTGALMSQEMLEEIVAIARRHGAYILCDEVYRHLTQEEGYCPSIVDLYEKGISVSSMSKVFSLAGIRLGWIASRDPQVLERALMSHPKLLMLDEPSMGLAPILVEQIFDIIQDLNRKGSTILLVEQNAQMALSVAHRGYVMETGKIVATGSGAELIESPEIKRAYLGG